MQKGYARRPTGVLGLQQALLGASEAARIGAQELVGCVRAARDGAEHACRHAELICTPVCRHVPRCSLHVHHAQVNVQDLIEEQ